MRGFILWFALTSLVTVATAAEPETPAQKDAEQKSAADIATAPIENQPARIAPEPGKKEAGEAPFYGVVNWFSWDYGPSPKNPEHKNWPAPFGYALVNFALFIGLLVKFAGKPIKLTVAARHDKIAKELDEATRLHAEAQSELEQYQEKLSHLDSDITTLLEQIAKEGEAERARLMQMAKDQAEWLKAEAQRQINTEIEAAREGLRVAVIDAAIAAAEKNIKDQVNEHDQRGLAERFVREVEEGKRSRS